MSSIFSVGRQQRREIEDAASLNLGKDFETCVCMTTGEVFFELEAIKTQREEAAMAAGFNGGNESLLKPPLVETLKYTSALNRFKNPELIAEVRALIREAGLSEFEIAQLGNLLPSELDEMKSLIPSVSAKLSPVAASTLLDDLKNVMRLQ